MAGSLRNQAPLTFTARTLSDANDGSNVQRGSMAALANLIPNPRNTGQFICRPAATVLVDFVNFFNSPTQITALDVVGDVAYGMVSTARFAGRDEPFAYDLVTGAFLPVAGVTVANTPLSPPASGEWTPPTMRRVGPREIVTHPGFPGGDIKFGWFDISGFSLVTTGNLDEQRTFIGDTDTTSQPFIVGLPPDTLPGDADIGFTVTGAGIPANTTIVGVEEVGVIFAGTTNGTINVTGLQVGGVPSTAGLFVGQVVQGSDIPDNTQIATINRGAFTLTLSQATTGLGIVGETLAAVGRRVRLSQNVTATADGVTFTFADPFVITGNPSILGVQTGAAVSGSGIPPDTSVVSTTTTTLVLSASTIAGLYFVDLLIRPSGVAVGMEVSGLGILPGTVVTAAAGLPSNVLAISTPATLTGPTTLTLTGAQVTLSSAAAAPANGVSLAFSGGTPAAPLWGAGDTHPINLPSVPVGVGEMNGRAWYALGEDGIGFTDALLPTQITNATQFLVPGNGLPVTAIGALQLTSTQLGGGVQGLLAFQRDADIQQITGDPSTNNLQMVDLRCHTGTHAPLTIVSTTKGTFFVSPEGLRLVGFNGQVSDPIGQDGQGIVAPFLEVDNPPVTGFAPASRMCAAANGRTVRITVPTDAAAFAEYWYDMARNLWTGPHSSTAGQIGNWSNTFLLAPTTPGRMTELRRSDDVPTEGSIYEEDAPLVYEWETSLLPDSGEMAMNTIIESAIMVALPPDEQAQVNFLNETRDNLDGVTLRGLVIPEGLWGQAVWGVTFMGPDTGAIRQRQLPWHRPLVFKQGRVNIRGLASGGIILGNFYMRYQVLGYLLEVTQIPAAPAATEFFLLANDGITILRNNGPVNLRPR